MKFGRALRSAFWRGSVDEEIDSELEFHVEMRTRELVERGMDRDAARQAAIARFGDIRRVRTMCRDLGRRRNRDMRRTQYLAELKQDVAFACRQLLKAPGFTCVAIATLALGLGATTAIFSVVHAVVLRPLPFPGPDRVFAVYETWRDFRRGRLSPGNFVETVSRARGFSQVAAVEYGSFNLGNEEDAERVVGARGTGAFFAVFDVAAAHGRVFGETDAQPGREQVVVLSHRLWTRRFGSNPAIVGTIIRLNGRPFEVIGVMPASFDSAVMQEELWVPMAFGAARRAVFDEHYLACYARLHPDVTREQAQAELDRLAADARAAQPMPNAQRGFWSEPLLESVVTNVRERLYILLGAVGLVLLIACGNVSNLLLARGAARSGELAVRAALGAGRWRLVRQLIAESLVLALLAAGAGVALAFWGIRALVAIAPPGVPRLEQATIDPVVLGFAAGAAVLSALLFGTVPALRAARADVRHTLSAGSRGAVGGVRDRLRTGLIVAEVALALLLLVGAGLLIRTAIALQRLDPGFAPARVLTARLSLAAGRDAPDAQRQDAATVLATFTRVLEQVSTVPGAEAAALVNQVPMGPGGNSNGLLVEGRPIDVRNAIDSLLRMVTPGYFSAMGIPILTGRGFDAGDRRGAQKVMIISTSLARAAFGDADPIGRRIACCEAGPDGTSPDYKTVVGVAGDVYSRGAAAGLYPEFYLPLEQLPDAAWDWTQRTLYVVVRTRSEPGALAGPLRRAAATAAPGIPVFNVRTMEERLADSLAAANFNTLLLTTLGAIGLLLAAVGIYGVIAYFVTRRTAEIGVRMALGASRRDVVGLVVRHAAVPILVGLFLGLVTSLAATRVLERELFGVEATDLPTLAATSLALAATGLVASVVPARRAASVDPTRALRMN